MICRSDRSNAPPALISIATDRDCSPYGLPFWMAYVGNSLVMTAIALLFRYADFITLLGGTEYHLGWIVGIGMVGSLLMRLLLGSGIDRYGPRWVWIGSLVVFALSCFAHLAIDTHAGPAVYLLRIAFCSAVAGIFGSSVTFISGRAPVARMAELIGMLGTSGFVGMVAGTQLGDWLCATETVTRGQVDQMFLSAGALGCLALLFATIATRGQIPPAPRKRPPLAWLIRRYHPGTVLLVGIGTGIGLGLPGIFLRPYAAELGLLHIAPFFIVYAPVAVVTRLLSRRLPERLGLAPMILAGMSTLVVSQLLFLVVDSPWSLAVPGIGCGIAHALLFPSVVAAGTQCFPQRYRGLGTTVTLASFDMGQLVGAPAAGAIVHFSSRVNLPPYPTMFLSMAAMLGLISLIFLVAPRRGAAGNGAARTAERALSRQPADSPETADLVV